MFLYKKLIKKLIKKLNIFKYKIKSKLIYKKNGLYVQNKIPQARRFGHGKNRKS